MRRIRARRAGGGVLPLVTVDVLRAACCVLQGAGGGRPWYTPLHSQSYSILPLIHTRRNWTPPQQRASGSWGPMGARGARDVRTMLGEELGALVVGRGARWGGSLTCYR